LCDLIDIDGSGEAAKEQTECQNLISFSTNFLPVLNVSDFTAVYNVDFF
jgi:hypothetical protein